MKLLKAT